MAITMAKNKFRWITDCSSVLLEGLDGHITVPSASDIYRAEFKSVFTVAGGETSLPSADLPDISFSKIPLQLTVHVRIGAFPECMVNASHAGQMIPVADVPERKADHILAGSAWYPFAKGSLEEVQKLLASAGITASGRISLSQYLKLVKTGSDLVHVTVESDASGESFAEGDVSGQISESPALKCTLYPYQERGVNWLRMIAGEGLGCILGDEMGLGKTLQVIALAVSEIQSGRSGCLIIAPATLLENWRREFAKFAPGTRTLIHRGAERTAFRADLMSTQIVITSYDTVIRDVPLFKAIDWNMIVLDEAQAIKNPETRRSVAVKNLPRRCGVAVTGTPVENRLMDLWSIMDFALPDYLGSRSSFERRFADTPDDAAWLEPLVTPVILRRRVADVAKDLPPRIDVPQVVELGPAAAAQYDQLRNDIFTEYGASATLVSLTKLRMYCTHPNLVLDPVRDPASVSQKYQRLLEILEEIFACNEKVLIFSSYSEMIDLLLRDMGNRFSGVYGDWIDGRVSVTDRQPRVDRFSSVNGPGLLVLNPKAAGTGLNVTAANHVIHYNLEWNPAAEDQASARAYRRGQDKPVTVHRLYYADTVEEVINERVERKRELVRSAIVGTSGETEDYDDIMRALSLSPSRE